MTGRAPLEAMMAEAPPAKNLKHQLGHAAGIREYAYRILEGEHKAGDGFESKDYIAFALFNRCLQTHEAAEAVIQKPLVDDGWVLVRCLVEYAVNCAYMLQVADAETANNYADYSDYERYKEFEDLRATDENLAGQIVSPEKAEKLRARYEKVRARYDDKRGDRWCKDERLYKRAARVDKRISEAKTEEHTEFLWLVNSIWRYASSYVHGSADSIAAQVTETEDGVKVQRKYSEEEAAEVLYSANFALYLVLLLVDLRLGGKNAQEIKRRYSEWAGISKEEA